jgi:WD40 repeat protein
MLPRSRQCLVLAATLCLGLGSPLPGAIRATDDALNAVAVSADGKRIAVGGNRGVILVWDLPGGRLRQQLPAESRLYALAFAPSGKTLAAGTERTGVQLWERDAERFVLKGRLSDTRTVFAVAFAPDGKWLAHGVQGSGWMYLYDVATRKQVGAFFERSNLTSGLAFAPDGRTLASAGNGFHRWDARPERLTTILRQLTPGQSVDKIDEVVRPARLWADKNPEPWEYSAAVAYSSNGKLLAGVNGTGGPGARAGGRTFRIWDAAGGGELRTGHAAGMRCVAFLPGDKRVVTGSDDGKLRIWSVATGAVNREWPAHPKEVRGVAVIPGTGHVVSAGEEGTVRIWDPETGVQSQRLRGPD